MLKNFIQNLALFLAGLLVFFIGLEIFLRVFLPQTAYRYPWPQYIFRNSETLGYEHTPGFHGRLKTPEFETSYDINSRGLRDKEHPAVKDRCRILGLGDSFTEGFGVDYDKTYLYDLEKLLNESGKRCEVINAGVSGYSTVQEFQYLKQEGLKYEPDIVILGFFCNDLVENLTEPSTVVDGYTVARGEAAKWGRLSFKIRSIFERLDSYRFIVRHISFSGSAAGFLKRVGIKSPAERYEGEKADILAKYGRGPGPLDKPFEFEKKLLAEMKAFLDGRGIRLLVVVIPENTAVYPEYKERAKKRFGLTDNDLDMERLDRRMSEACSAGGIEYIDLLRPFREHAARGEELYFRLNNHFTPSGHMLAAGLINARLKELVWLPH